METQAKEGVSFDNAPAANDTNARSPSQPTGSDAAKEELTTHSPENLNDTDTHRLPISSGAGTSLDMTSHEAEATKPIDLSAFLLLSQQKMVRKFKAKPSTHGLKPPPFFARPPQNRNKAFSTYGTDHDDTDRGGLFLPELSYSRSTSTGIESHVDTSRKHNLPDSEKHAKLSTTKRPRSGYKSKRASVGCQGLYSESAIGNLFKNDVFHDTAATAHLGTQPEFGNQTRRKDMWKEMLAKLPEENRKDAQHDQRALDEAVAYINGNENGTGRRTVYTAAGTDMWNIKGIKTTLKSYQIMGVSFMRKREHSQDEPRGGLLCDGMGLGKTLQCLTNIVNGKPPPGARAKATLIVASPALVRQWRAEIEIHCEAIKGRDGWGVGDIVEYHAGSRCNHSNLKEMLSNACIVLTTYSEVARSYPKATVPVQLVTAQEKDRWWKKHFEEHRGALHEIDWYRVCLDEAAVIKNHACHTSMACRALNYEHGWAITGTPIMNNLGEFYALFKFVRCPNTTTYNIFKENFEDVMDLEGVGKLCYFLEEYMIRRTHADTLFNARLLDLPKPDEKTTWISFTPLERQIYSIIQDRLIKKINTIASHEGVQADKSNSHIWTLLLRLRQMCSHVLLIQDVVVDVLERSDFEKLNAICDQNEGLNNEGRNLLLSLRQVIQDSIEDKVDAKMDEDGNVDYDKVKETYELEHVSRKSICVRCGGTAVEAVMTSCFHLYCFACLETLQHDAARMGFDAVRCAACNSFYTSASRIDINPVDIEPPSDCASSSIAKRTRKSSKKNPTGSLPILHGKILCSAKTRAAKKQIEEWFRDDPTCKIIIYTQFLQIVEIMGKVCESKNWGYVRYVGTMSHISRSKMIERFDSEPETRIMLASLKCGGIGLNLTMASRVLNLDPWFNLAVEDQAFCRVYRIGQQKETQMTRVVVRDSIDSAMHALKERKQVEIDAVMDTRGRKFSVRELMELLGKVRDDSRGRPYIVRGGLLAGNSDDRG